MVLNFLKSFYFKAFLAFTGIVILFCSIYNGSFFSVDNRLLYQYNVVREIPIEKLKTKHCVSNINFQIERYSDTSWWNCNSLNGKIKGFIHNPPRVYEELNVAYSSGKFFIGTDDSPIYDTREELERAYYNAAISFTSMIDSSYENSIKEKERLERLHD